jgi:HAMP domain-containing protein
MNKKITIALLMATLLIAPASALNKKLSDYDQAVTREAVRVGIGNIDGDQLSCYGLQYDYGNPELVKAVCDQQVARFEAALDVVRTGASDKEACAAASALKQHFKKDIASQPAYAHAFAYTMVGYTPSWKLSEQNGLASLGAPQSLAQAMTLYSQFAYQQGLWGNESVVQAVHKLQTYLQDLQGSLVEVKEPTLGQRASLFARNAGSRLKGVFVLASKYKKELTNYVAPAAAGLAVIAGTYYFIKGWNHNRKAAQEDKTGNLKREIDQKNAQIERHEDAINRLQTELASQASAQGGVDCGVQACSALPQEAVDAEVQACAGDDLQGHSQEGVQREIEDACQVLRRERDRAVAQRKALVNLMADKKKQQVKIAALSGWKDRVHQTKLSKEVAADTEAKIRAEYENLQGEYEESAKRIIQEQTQELQDKVTQAERESNSLKERLRQTSAFNQWRRFVDQKKLKKAEKAASEVKRRFDEAAKKTAEGLTDRFWKYISQRFSRNQKGPVFNAPEGKIEEIGGEHDSGSLVIVQDRGPDVEVFHPAVEPNEPLTTLLNNWLRWQQNADGSPVAISRELFEQVLRRVDSARQHANSQYRQGLPAPQAAGGNGEVSRPGARMDFCRPPDEAWKRLQERVKVRRRMVGEAVADGAPGSGSELSSDDSSVKDGAGSDEGGFRPKQGTIRTHFNKDGGLNLRKPSRLPGRSGKELVRRDSQVSGGDDGTDAKDHKSADLVGLQEESRAAAEGEPGSEWERFGEMDSLLESAQSEQCEQSTGSDVPATEEGDLAVGPSVSEDGVGAKDGQELGQAESGAHVDDVPANTWGSVLYNAAAKTAGAVKSTVGAAWSWLGGNKPNEGSSTENVEE